MPIIIVIAFANLYNIESIYIGNSNIWDWRFVENLDKLKDVYISMLYEYNEYNWSPLKESKSIETFTAKLIHYDKSLLEAIKDIPTLKSVDVSFVDYDSVSESDRLYTETWITELEERGVNVTFK